MILRENFTDGGETVRGACRFPFDSSDTHPPRIRRHDRLIVAFMAAALLLAAVIEMCN